MTPLILSAPERGGLRALRALGGSSIGPTTLAWCDHKSLEDSVTDMISNNGNALFVDVDVEGAAAAALAHQIQVMGVPQFVAVVVEHADDLGQAVDLARLVLASVPRCAVLVVGGPDSQRAIAGVALELELSEPLNVAIEDLLGTAEELVAAAQWEDVS